MISNSFLIVDNSMKATIGDNNHNAREVRNSGANAITTTKRIRRKSLGIPMHPVSKIEIAEMTKIIAITTITFF